MLADELYIEIDAPDMNVACVDKWDGGSNGPVILETEIVFANI